MQTFFGKFKNVKLRDIGHIFLFLAALPIALIYKRKRKDLWLLCDNGNEAADNGYVLFKYICENHPEQDAVFAVCKNSADLSKVKATGQYVYYGSFRHWVLYLAARVNISSQKGGKPNFAVCNLLEVYGILKNRRVFLQHGIIMNDLEFLHYKNAKIGLFITSTAREHEFISSTFGYPEGSVKKAGIARLDNLHEFEVQDGQILIMPTWREWLGSATLAKNMKKNLAKFSDSEYFKYYSDLINSEKLRDICQKNGCKVMFYLHREAQPFADLFKTDNPYITICKYPEYRVDDLLKKSQFLVTDYSSIQMDFAYMKKPMAYFQFDFDKFFTAHYKKGYFDFQDDGFGPVFTDVDGLVDYIGERAANQLENTEPYISRANEFFDLYDTDNCKRNYEVIKEKWS